ncbi:MAG: HIT domain-containing protein [Candidatus Pacearchaeota archaeon]
MTLTPEQTEAIKEQLVQNIEKSFPEDKKEFAKSQIESMDSEQLEEFLKKNNLEVKSGQLTSSGQEGTNCIFCSIVSEDVESYKISENNDSIAVLELNPLSKGHIIIIPKLHVPSSDEMPSSAFELSKKVSKKIKEKLTPKKVDVSTSNTFGHEIINIVPIYDEETPSKRKPAKPEELEEMKKTLEIKEETPVKKESKPENIVLDSNNFWLPKRIP